MAREPKRKKWRDEFLFTAYRITRDGGRGKDIAAALGVHPQMIVDWKKQHPLLAMAITTAKSDLKEFKQTLSKTPEPIPLHDCIYNRLPPDLQRYWDRITEWEDEKDGARRIDLMLENAGDNVRKALFIHAFQYFNFQLLPAMRKVGISRVTFNRWKKHDIHFQDMISTMDDMKGDFYEDALNLMVQMGNVHAIIFANKTYNKNRGYSEKVDVSVQGEITHRHNIVLDDEALRIIPIEYRRKLLEHLEEKKVEARVV